MMGLDLDITNSFQRTFETQQQQQHNGDKDPIWKQVSIGVMVAIDQDWIMTMDTLYVGRQALLVE